MKKYDITKEITEYGKLYNFSLYFPYIYEDAKEIFDLNPIELLVERNNGSKLIYNEFHNSVRYIPKDPHNMTEEECRSEFKYRLLSCMERYHMSQGMLSEVTGISQHVLSRYMNGVSIPSFQNLDKIAKALGCSMDEFRYV